MRTIFSDKRLLIIFGNTLMIVMGVSSIMPVLPLMGRELDVPTESISLILTCFTFPGIFLTPLAGIIADRYGRKIVLIPSLLLFGLAGGACGLTKDLNSLLALRILQGVGAAPLGVLYSTIIGDIYKGKDRIRIMGYNAMMLSLGTAIFPAIGGFLGELGWNWPFFLPLTALPLAYAAYRHLEIPEPGKGQSLKEYLSTSYSIIKERQSLALFAVTLLTFCILYGPIVTFFPILADTTFSVKPSEIGGLFSLSSLATAIAASQIGRLNKYISEKTMLCISQILYFVSMVLIPFAPHYWWLLGPICVFGLAQGFNFPNLSTLLTSLAPLEQRAAIMAVNGTILRLAQTIAPVLFTLLFWVGGLNAAFYGGAVCGIIMLIITIRYISSEKKYN